MKSIGDVRKCAAERGLDEDEVLEKEGRLG
jgi:hypothetical protein